MNAKAVWIASLLAALAAPSLAQAKGPYEVKSGTYEMAPPVGEGGVVVQFDEYGLKMATHTTTKIFGTVTRSVKIELPDGTTYEYDPDKKTGTVTRMSPEAAQAMAAAMAPAMMKDAKVKDLPGRTFLGKTCKGTEAQAMGMVTRTWTYKGISLYSETSAAGGSGKPVVLRVTKLTEGAVPAGAFTVPAGVKIEDLSKSQ